MMVREEGAAGAAALAVDRLDVAYGAARVLHDVSLQVAAGEFVALLGSSGCGKTTLLRTIAGFARPSAGRITVGETDVTALPPDRRGMALVFQSYALWPHMTAGQNIGWGLKLRGVGKAERRQRVEAMLALLGLDGLADRPVTRLSGGQRQRVALGRALAINPRILLLDEPLSNLDARIRQVVRHEIKALQSKLGITTIHVTHDREEAMVMADRIAILDQGRLVQLGTPEEVYNRPASAFVASFMGADNVLGLEIAAHDEAVIEVAAGPGHAGARLSRAGVNMASPRTGAVQAHFRSESARLMPPGEPADGELRLAGSVAQASYPGGRWRYAVTVGGNQLLVDDERRLAVGDPVAVAIPASGLHLYPQ